MSNFTVFFCGTGSNSFDFANKNYPKGELVSTLARHHKGSEFVDWIICDGPGSGNLQEDEKWVLPGNYSWARGTGFGTGWEENVAHAMAMIKGEPEWERPELTDKEIGKLKAAGIDVEDPKNIGSWYWRVWKYPQRKITPQALQRQKILIMRKGKVPKKVNIVGWSRGGVSCIMLANAMAKDPVTKGIKVNIFAVDPVPGSGNFQVQRCFVPGNVEQFVGVYARDERSKGFAPIVPDLSSGTASLILPFPGKHATLPGNGAADGGDGGQQYPQVGAVVRNLAEKFLTEWGTPVDKRLNLKPADLDKLYKEIADDAEGYKAMWKKVYTMAENQDGERYIGLGKGGKGAAFSDAQAKSYIFPKGLAMTDDEVRDALKKA